MMGHSVSLPPQMKASLLQAQRPPEPRKVAVAFDNVTAGRNLLQWALTFCLLPDDELFVVHCFARVSGRI